jgi:hypothetical protein
MLSCPLEKNDARLKEQAEIIHEQLAFLRPIESQIEILKAKAKPYLKKIDAAMQTIQRGGKEETSCEITIDHTNCWIKVVRLDTGEVVTDRPAEESELDPDFFDKDVAAA